MDFCRDVMNPIFTSNKPSVDGGEVTNLIGSSNQNSLNNYGFVCESFVRSPADITVEFPVPIDIARVDLNIEVGARRSRGISIFAIFKSDYVHQLTSSIATENLPISVKKSMHGVLTYQKDSACNEQNLVCLGRWFVEKESVIVLKNFHYKQHIDFSLPALSSECAMYYGSLRHPLRCPITGVKALVIRILSVIPTGSPVLRSLHIFGEPSMGVCSSKRNKIIQKWLMVCKDNIKLEEKLSTSLLESSNNEGKSSSISYDTSDIPEDFLDCLTCEIMTVPLLLPSGNSIDLETLEKFIAAEATWGRQPSDPFTGVPFKVGYGPEPNVALKARIDRFILTNGNPEVNITQHTVGSCLDGIFNSASGKRNEVKITEECSAVKRRKVDISNVPELASSSNVLTRPSTSSNNHSSEVSCSKLDRLKDLLPIGPALPPKVPSRASSANTNSDHVRSRHSLVRSLGNAVSLSSKTATGAQSKADSLVSLKTGSSSSFRDIPPAPKSIKSGDILPVENFSLDSLLQGSTACLCGQKEVLYELQCNHILCKSCISSRPHLPFNSVICEQCNQISHSHQISRHHRPSIFKRPSLLNNR